MVGRTVFRCFLIVAALVGARSVSADPITLTGNVANDFNPTTNPGVVVITDSLHQNDPAHIAQPAWMTSAGLVSGWNIKDVRLDYNAATDTMYVGVNTYGVAGDAYGGGTPPAGTVGSNPANFGGDKSMAVGFAPLNGTFSTFNLPTPAFVAGISGDQSQRGTGLDGFTVAKYAGGTSPGTIDLATGFGKALSAPGSSLAFNPSPATPGFEFTITNFSKLLGANPANGLVVMTQDGSVNSVVIGKDELVGVVPQFEPQQIPEPTTWMVWAGLAGGLAWKLTDARGEPACEDRCCCERVTNINTHPCARKRPLRQPSVFLDRRWKTASTVEWASD